MKCIEVSLNGGEPLLVGAHDAPYLGGSLFLPRSGLGGLVFTARIASGSQSSETQTWVLSGLKRDDELRLRIVESTHASAATTSVAHGVANDSSSEDHGCSVCRRRSSEVAKLLAVGPVSICDQCIDLCHEAIHGGGSSEA